MAIVSVFLIFRRLLYYLADGCGIYGRSPARKFSVMSLLYHKNGSFLNIGWLRFPTTRLFGRFGTVFLLGTPDPSDIDRSLVSSQGLWVSQLQCLGGFYDLTRDGLYDNSKYSIMS